MITPQVTAMSAAGNNPGAPGSRQKLQYLSHSLFLSGSTLRWNRVLSCLRDTGNLLMNFQSSRETSGGICPWMGNIFVGTWQWGAQCSLVGRVTAAQPSILVFQVSLLLQAHRSQAQRGNDEGRGSGRSSSHDGFRDSAPPLPSPGDRSLPFQSRGTP